METGSPGLFFGKFSAETPQRHTVVKLRGRSHAVNVASLVTCRKPRAVATPTKPAATPDWSAQM